MSVARTVYCFRIPPLIVGTLERMPTPGTSESSPLRVAAVTPGERHGRIGITLCPGKTDPAGMSGAWARALDTDLDAIQRWGATAVVSLITDEEFDLLSVRGLPGAVRSRHMEWWHAPIPDGRPPGPDFEDAWAVADEAVRDRLSLGFDVLVHCRGVSDAPEPSRPACWWCMASPVSTRSSPPNTSLTAPRMRSAVLRLIAKSSWMS